MKEFIAGQFDIAVIGAGHAGLEAAPQSRAKGAAAVTLAEVRAKARAE